jgi:hypothetical protein
MSASSTTNSLNGNSGNNFHRNSMPNGFLPSNVSDNSSLQTTPKKNTSKKEKQFEKILSQKLINIAELKALSWQGIPFGN